MPLLVCSCIAGTASSLWGVRVSSKLRPRGGVVTHRSAKPFTPVQFRAWPPTIHRTEIHSITGSNAYALNRRGNHASAPQHRAKLFAARHVSGRSRSSCSASSGRRAEQGEVILRPDAPFEYVYFLESGLVSIVATPPDGRRIEVGLYGREGLGAPQSCSVTTGLRMNTSSKFRERDCAFRPILCLRRFNRALPSTVCCSSMRVCSSCRWRRRRSQTATIRWRNAWRDGFSCHDRVDGDELSITHQSLGIMLAVRRSGVTLAIQTLESAQIVRAYRGCVVVRDRAKLEEIAGGSYGPAEAAYERLIGPPH